MHSDMIFYRGWDFLFPVMPHKLTPSRGVWRATDDNPADVGGWKGSTLIERKPIKDDCGEIYE